MVTVFPKSVHQPNKMALSICNCFRLMRDWKLGNLANDKVISTVPFRMEKENYLCRECTVSIIFYNGFSGKLGCLPFSKKNLFENEMEHKLYFLKIYLEIVDYLLR